VQKQRNQHYAGYRIGLGTGARGGGDCVGGSGLGAGVGLGLDTGTGLGLGEVAGLGLGERAGLGLGEATGEGERLHISTRQYNHWHILLCDSYTYITRLVCAPDM
jgi:hypothetical protein